MQYSEIVGVEPLFDSTFNITEEKENYWKQFITNAKFESNLQAIINVFDSPTSDQHKSIWVQGTYGTGKSHSTAVTKHLLCDKMEDIEDYIDRLSQDQLKQKLKIFRKKNRVFPVVLKGTYSIVDTEELKYTIQRFVTDQIKAAGYSITVKSDFQAVIEMLEDDKFKSFWDAMLSNELFRYASDINELKDLLSEGNVEVLKVVNTSLKKSNIIKATPDIKQWLTEVVYSLREQGIADYLVIFWDEFTSLLEIAERRSILNCMQDLAELSKAPTKEDKTKYIGVYVFLVTHKSMESTDSYKELKEDEKTMAKARFLTLQYDMQDITTYHILSNAMKVLNEKVYNRLADERINLQMEVAKALDEIVAPMDKPAVVKQTIKRLYPFHPYTAYLATFVSRAIGSAERSIFEFLNDDVRGFKNFIQNDTKSVKYLTADKVWDFFAEAFSEDRTNNFDTIINKYSMYSPKLKDEQYPVLTVFKVILLLNLLNRVTQMDGAEQEKSLVNPSTKNIHHVLSGAWKTTDIDKALEEIDEKQIVPKGPDDVYEVSSSSMPIERVQSAKDKLYLKYEDVSNILNQYVGLLADIRLVITKSEGFNRAIEFSVVWGNLALLSMESKLQRAFTKKYAVKIALVLFRGDTPFYDRKSNRPEIAIEKQKLMIQELSQKDTMRDVVFIVSDGVLGQQGFEGFIDAKAREEVAKALKIEDPAPYEKKAERWVMKWKDSIISSSISVLFRGEYVSLSTYKNVYRDAISNNVTRIFPKGAERLSKIAAATTAWRQVFAKKTVEKICFAATREEIEKLSGAEAPLSFLLKDPYGQWLFDEKLNYIGEQGKSCPMTILIKAIDDKIAALRNKTVVDMGREFLFLSEPPYGYYNTHVCMGSIALAFRRYTGKMYLADQGSLMTPTLMRDMVNALFSYWLENKQDLKLRVRFSTAEEKELIDMIHSIFSVTGDGISETKWQLRSNFEKKYKSPLWALKYVVNKGNEFNSVIDLLFSLAITAGESITQEEISQLLEGLKKQKTSISLALEKVKDEKCLYIYIDHCLKQVGTTISDYSNVISFLKQNLSDEIVFWREADVDKQVLVWFAFQSAQGPDGGNNPSDGNDGNDDISGNGGDDGSYPDDFIDDVDGGEISPDDGGDEYDPVDEHIEDGEGLGPVFEPIKITPIEVGKTHATIEAAMKKINVKDFDNTSARTILTKLCKEYPVICDAVMRLIDEV